MVERGRWAGGALGLRVESWSNVSWGQWAILAQTVLAQEGLNYKKEITITKEALATIQKTWYSMTLVLNIRSEDFAHEVGFGGRPRAGGAGTCRTSPGGSARPWPRLVLICITNNTYYHYH